MPVDASAGSRLPELIALAEEASSDSRRALLRELTDSFFGAATRPVAEQALYDDVLSRLADEMEIGVREELAQRFADSPSAPRGLVRRLSMDDARVAAPVLARSPVLTEDDLMAVARSQGQEHLRALSSRPGMSTAVSDVLVERGDDQTLGVLLANPAAPLSRASAEIAVRRAGANPALHEAAVERRNLPPDLLNQMYFVVEARLRRRILERNADIPADQLEQALSAVHARVAIEDGALPSDYPQAVIDARAVTASGAVSPEALVTLLRRPSRTAFLVALADLADVDYALAAQIVERREIDALAVLCRAADLDRALFLTFVIAILGGGDANAIGQAKSYGRLYADLTRDQALRTVRFWRARRGSQAA